MASNQRQGQEQHQQQQIQQQHNDPNGSSGLNGYSQYTNPNSVNGSSNDDFSTYFNVPGNEDATTVSSQNKPTSQLWNTNAIDPRLQQTASFSRQQTSTWSPNAFQQNSSIINSGQRTATPDISAAFRSNSNPYYPNTSFNENPYSNTAYYPQNVAYNSAGFVPQQFYGYSNGMQGQATAQGQTISPSALQSYSNSSNPQARQGYQQPVQDQTRNISYYGNTGGNARPSLRTYDDTISSQLLSALPAGINKGKGLAKKIDALESATNSKAIGNFLVLGNEIFDSDPITGIYGKTEIRKSLNGMKRKIEEQQNGRPWENAQLPILKRVKFSHRTTKPLNLAAGSTAQVELSSSGDEASSEEDSEYESDDGVDESSPLPSLRPSDPVKAMEYDVIRSMWFKKSKHLGGNTIREALGSYWTLLKPMRDKWKAEITAITEATTKNDQVTVENHKTIASKYRSILNAAFRATVRYGHDDIVGKLSENVNLFLSFYQILVDRFKESDINGETVINILSLVVRCTSTTAALLEKTKLDKILPRLAKKGNDAVKDMLQKIEETVKANTEITAADTPKAEDVKLEKSAIVSANATKVMPKAKAKVTTLGSIPKSMTIVGNAKSSIPAKNSADGVTKAPSLKADVKKTDPKAKIVSELSKAKPIAPGRTPSVFAGLQSASKKPGTSNAAQKAALTVEKKDAKPTDVKKITTTTSTKSFSFADAIASIGQTKEVSMKRKVEDDKPPETEEERQKRERKESRRSLRVRWRPDALLVEIRLFTHDPEEEMGHNSNLLRDAADVKNEGRMLKLHKDLRIDEEEDMPEEVELAPWHDMSLIDMTDLPDDAKADNYEAYGGGKRMTSPEKEVQTERERSTLIAIYTSRADIPFSPKEPLDPYSGPIEPTLDFGWGEDANFKEIKRRESKYFAAQRPMGLTSVPSTTTDIHSILSILQQGQQLQHQPSFLGFPGFPGQALPPPPPPPPPPISYAQQPAIPQPGSVEWIISQLAQQSQAQPQSITFPPPPPPFPPPPLNASSTPSVDPAILQALTAFRGMQSIPPQQPSFLPPRLAIVPPPPPQQSQQPSIDLSAILAQINAAQQQPQQSQPFPFNSENERKRSYDDDQFGGQSKRARGDKGN